MNIFPFGATCHFVIGTCLLLLGSGDATQAQNVSAVENPLPNSRYLAAWAEYADRLGDLLTSESKSCGPDSTGPIVGLGLMGAIAGAVAGAAIGGSSMSALKGAAAGGAIGTVAAVGETAARRPRTNLRSQAVCRSVQSEYKQYLNLTQDLLRQFGPACEVGGEDAFRNPAGSMHRLTATCITNDYSKFQIVLSRFEQLGSMNTEDCNRISTVLAVSERGEVLTENRKNRRNNQAAFPMEIPSCLLSMPVPTTTMAATLAKMARIAYDRTPTVDLGDSGQVDGFTRKPLHQVFTGGFFACVFTKGDTVVIAIRGTDISIGLLSLETDTETAYANLMTDASWIENVAVNVSGTSYSINYIAAQARLGTDYILQSARLLSQLRSEYPTAHMILTGHSLGAAVAQILAADARLDALVFDAPGAATLRMKYWAAHGLESAWGNSASTYEKQMAEVGTTLELLNNQSRKSPPRGSNLNINYRMLGDHVSTAGKQIGAVCTVFQEDSVALTDIVEHNWLSSHWIDLMVSQLQQEAPQAPGVIELGERFPQGEQCSTL